MRLAIRAAQIGISFLVAACGGSGADEDESPTLSAEVATWTSDYAEAYCNSAWDCGCEGPSADLATCIDDVSEQVTAAAIAALADGLQFAAQCAAKQIAYYERDGTSLHCLGPATFTYANRHEPDMCNVFGGSATPGDSCAVAAVSGIDQFASECRGADTHGCYFGKCSGGSASAVVLLGGSCYPDSDFAGACEPGLHCYAEGSEGTCRLPLGGGESCIVDCQCDSQECGSNGTCTEPPPACGASDVGICGVNTETL